MTTVEERMKELLMKKGMSPRQADKVMAQAEANIEEMKGRWQDDVADVPTSTLTVIWANVSAEALDWIDENLPNAFFRPLFA